MAKCAENIFGCLRNFEQYAAVGDRAMRIILKEFSFMQGLDMMLIQNTVFVDVTDYLAAFLQSKLSVVEECLLTESTNSLDL